LVEGDIRDFSLGQQFGLITLAYSSLLELDSEADRKKTLECCRKHLAPEGTIVIDNFFYGEGAHKDWGKFRPDNVVMYYGTYPDPTGSEGIIQQFEADVFDRARMLMMRTVFVDHVSPSGEVRREALTVTRRYVPPEQMHAELSRAGFSHIEVYGGFNREPLYDPAPFGYNSRVRVFVDQRLAATKELYCGVGNPRKSIKIRSADLVRVANAVVTDIASSDVL